MQCISGFVKEAYRGRFSNQVQFLPQHFGFSPILARARGSVLTVLAFRLKGEAKLNVSSSVIAGGGHGFGNLGLELCPSTASCPGALCCTLKLH